MGMSASQARFLALTARKSNTEYQGQQVNQQRTTLANESAGLFNQMLTLQVPTPPSATDFYSMAYTFPGESAMEECRITNWSTSTNPEMGAYNIDVKRTINDVGVKTPEMQLGAIISYDGEKYTMKIPSYDKDGELTGYINSDLTKSTKDVNGNKKEDGVKDYKECYTYKRNGRNYFVTEELLESMFNGSNSNFTPKTDAETGLKTVEITKENQSDAIESYYKGEKTVETITYIGVTMETDDTGRFVGMTYSPTNDPLDMKYTDLTIEQVHDDEGYDRAMQEYNYKKMLYDRTMEDISTRTKIIQQEDKALELNLKQLDTEQEAIQTEMDAVKKVIEKNVETSFKTFA